MSKIGVAEIMEAVSPVIKERLREAIERGYVMGLDDAARAAEFIHVNGSSLAARDAALAIATTIRALGPKPKEGI